MLRVVFRKKIHEGLEHFGVEVVEHFVAHDLEGLEGGLGFFVAAFGGEGVEYVGDAAYAGVFVYFVGFEAAGVASAVVAFVVLHGDVAAFFGQVAGFFEYLETLEGVAAHEGHFFVGEASGFVDDAGGYADFSEVVEEESCSEFAHVVAIVTFVEFFCEGDGVDADVDGVGVGVEVVVGYLEEAGGGFVVVEYHVDHSADGFFALLNVFGGWMFEELAHEFE